MNKKLRLACLFVHPAGNSGSHVQVLELPILAYLGRHARADREVTVIVAIEVHGVLPRIDLLAVFDLIDGEVEAISAYRRSFGVLICCGGLLRFRSWFPRIRVLG